MKVTGLLVAVLVLVASLQSPAAAWFVAAYHISGALPGVYGPKAELWCGPGATDGYDGERRIDISLDGSIFFAVRKVSGVGGWDGDTGWYGQDIRPDPATGQTLVFDDIYLWARPGTTPQNVLLDQWYAGALPGWTYRLRLVYVPVGVSYSGPRQWGLGPTVITLPFYATADGTTGYKFRAEVTAIPDPSSLLALAAGLAGLAGIARRRRCS